MKSVRAFLYVVVVAFSLASTVARAALPADVAARVAHYKKVLVEWSHNPVFVAALKSAEATPGGLIPGMTNVKWLEVADNDARAQLFQTSTAGALTKRLVAENPAIDKLYLRDTEGFLIASSNKPLLYNNSGAPVFKKTMAARTPWSANSIKPDTTTQKNGVHVGVPVFDHGKLIGMLHTSVVAK